MYVTGWGVAFSSDESPSQTRERTPIVRKIIPKPAKTTPLSEAIDIATNSDEVSARQYEDTTAMLLAVPI